MSCTKPPSMMTLMCGIGVSGKYSKQASIFVWCPPQKKKDVLNDVHSIVVASAVTAKVCKDFIVANSLSVRDNKLFTSLEGDNNQLADAHQGDVNQWQGIGLGRFMMQFLAFYHYQHYSKAVPILVQIATNNVKAKV